PAAVRIRYLDAEGVDQEQLLDGLSARSVQHQIDHLDGRMYFERLGSVRRRRLLDKARKLAKGSGR
ncbi:MAG: peptide deformylase, partial [Pikeienuella sp.]